MYDPLSNRPTFPSVTAEILIALDILEKTQLQLSSGFPHTIAAHLGNVSKFLLCSLSLFPPSICCPFMLELHHGFTGQPNRSPSKPACLPDYKDGPFLCVEDALIKDLPAFPSFPSPIRAAFHRISCSRSLSRQSPGSATLFHHSPRDLQLHDFITTTAELTTTSPVSSSFVSERQVQLCVTPGWPIR